MFQLEPSPQVRGGWRFLHDPRGAFICFDMESTAASTGDFQAMHRTLSTSPESGFVRVATVQRRLNSGTEILRGCVFTELDGVNVRQREIDTPEEWWGLVLDGFGLAYGDLLAGERDLLWRKVRSTHEAWDAAGRP